MFDSTHLHAMIVHFPIALLIIGFLSDVIGIFFRKDFFSKAGLYLLILGTAGVFAAYFSGNFAGGGITEAGALKNALETHEEAAELSLWIMSIAAIGRIVLVLMKRYNGFLRVAAFAVFLIGVASIARTGYYGGQLVYKHAAGVQFNLGFNFEAGQTFNQNDTKVTDEIIYKDKKEID